MESGRGPVYFKYPEAYPRLVLDGFLYKSNRLYKSKREEDTVYFECCVKSCPARVVTTANGIVKKTNGANHKHYRTVETYDPRNLDILDPALLVEEYLRVQNLILDSTSLKQSRRTDMPCRLDFFSRQDPSSQKPQQSEQDVAGDEFADDASFVPVDGIEMQMEVVPFDEERPEGDSFLSSTQDQDSSDFFHISEHEVEENEENGSSSAELHSLHLDSDPIQLTNGVQNGIFTDMDEDGENSPSETMQLSSSQISPELCATDPACTSDALVAKTELGQLEPGHDPVTGEPVSKLKKLLSRDPASVGLVSPRFASPQSSVTDASQVASSGPTNFSAYAASNRAERAAPRIIKLTPEARERLGLKPVTKASSSPVRQNGLKVPSPTKTHSKLPKGTPDLEQSQLRLIEEQRLAALASRKASDAQFLAAQEQRRSALEQRRAAEAQRVYYEMLLTGLGVNGTIEHQQNLTENCGSSV